MSQKQLSPGLDYTIDGYRSRKELVFSEFLVSYFGGMEEFKVSRIKYLEPRQMQARQNQICAQIWMRYQVAGIRYNAFNLRKSAKSAGSAFFVFIHDSRLTTHTEFQVAGKTHQNIIPANQHISTSPNQQISKSTHHLILSIDFTRSSSFLMLTRARKAARIMATGTPRMIGKRTFSPSVCR